MVKPEWTLNMKEVGCSSPRLEFKWHNFVSFGVLKNEMTYTGIA